MNWSLTLADSNQQYVRDMRVLPNGEILLTGEYGTMPFKGGIPVRGWSGPEQFLLKLDAKGDTVWFRHWGTTYNSSSGSRDLSLDVDAQGRIYVSGWTNNAENNPARYFGKTGDTLIADPAAGGFFIVQYQPDGSVSWLRQFSAGTRKAGPNQIIALDEGFIIQGPYAGVAGFHGLADSVQSPSGNFLAGGNADGSGLWIRPFRVDSTAFADIEYVQAPAPGKGSYVDSSEYLERRDGAGRLIWKSRPAKSGGFHVHSMVSSPGGSVYLYGYADSGATFSREGLGDTSIGALPPQDHIACLLKVDAEGKVRWVRSYAVNSNQANNARPHVMRLGSDGVLNILSDYLKQGWERIDSLGRLLYAQPDHAGYLQISTGQLGCDSLGHIVFAGTYYYEDFDFLGAIFRNYRVSYDIFVAQVDAGPSSGVRIPFRPKVPKSYARPYDGLGRKRKQAYPTPIFRNHQN